MIYEKAFYNCIRLQTIEILSDSLFSIFEKNAFDRCPIKSIFIQFKVSRICENAFAFRKQLKNVDFALNSKLNVEDEVFMEISILIGACSSTCVPKLKKL